MVLNPDTKYPNRRTFIVKLRHDATPDDLRGRVENLLTCEQHEFASSHELVALLAIEKEDTTTNET